MPDPIQPAPDPTTPPPDSPEVAAPTPTPADTQAEEMAVIDAAIAAADAGTDLPPAELSDGPPEPVDAADPVNPDGDPAAAPAPDADPPPDPNAPTPEEAEDAKVAADLGIKNERANKEFRSMRAAVRELEPLREPAQKWTQMETFLREAEIAPQDFGGAMNILAAFKPTAPIEAKREAFKALVENARILGAQIGEVADGFDPLTLPENKDLLERVEEEGTIDRASALEVARARAMGRHHAAVTATQTQSVQQQQAYETAKAQAVSDLNTLGATLAAADPQYAEKTEAMRPMMTKLFLRLHPSQWATTFQEAYAEYRLPVSAPPPRAPAPLVHQPLRPTGAKLSALSPEIKTDMDAIEAGLLAANKLNGVAAPG